MKAKKQLFLVSLLVLYPIFFSFSISAAVTKSVPYIVRVVSQSSKSSVSSSTSLLFPINSVKADPPPRGFFLKGTRKIKGSYW